MALTGLDPEFAAAVARRVADELSAAVSAPVEVGASEVAVGASVGIGVYHVDGEEFGAMLHSTDVDMYARKTAGRGTAGRGAAVVWR